MNKTKTILIRTQVYNFIPVSMMQQAILEWGNGCNGSMNSDKATNHN